MKMNAFLLLMFLMIVAVIGLPTMSARFAGTHTIERNKTAVVKGLDCIGCHEYIWDELSATEDSRAVRDAHKRAVGNDSYTVDQFYMNISAYGLTSDTNHVLCYLCHVGALNASGDPLSPSHTQTTIRACADWHCHGLNESTNNTGYGVGNMTALLAVKNVHERVFDSLNSVNSLYVNETGANYTRGFFFCLVCHTELQAQLTYPEGATEYFMHNDSDVQRRRYL